MRKGGAVDEEDGGVSSRHDGFGRWSLETFKSLKKTTQRGRKDRALQEER